MDGEGGTPPQAEVAESQNLGGEINNNNTYAED